MSAGIRRECGRPAPAARPRRAGVRPSAFPAAVLLGLAAACGPEPPIEPPQPLPGESTVEYPVELWDAKVEGETVVMVHVDEEGAVDSAYVDRTSGLEDFDSAAVRAAREMRFTPAMQGTRRRAMWTRLPVRFRLDATASTGILPPTRSDSGR